MLFRNETSQNRQPEGDSCLQSYVAYYTANLFFNVLLLAFYAVMVISSHEPCLTRSGTNITDGFEMAFLLGLFVLVGDFINSNIISILFRFKKQHEQRKFGISLKFTSRMTETTAYFEWGYRLMTVIISILQLQTTHSRLGDYCVNQLGVLGLEGRWMNTIITFQSVKVLLFSFWQYNSYNSSNDENDQSQSECQSVLESE